MHICTIRLGATSADVNMTWIVVAQLAFCCLSGSEYSTVALVHEHMQYMLAWLDTT